MHTSIAISCIKSACWRSIQRDWIFPFFICFTWLSGHHFLSGVQFTSYTTGVVQNVNWIQKWTPFAAMFRTNRTRTPFPECLPAEVSWMPIHAAGRLSVLPGPVACICNQISLPLPLMWELMAIEYAWYIWHWNSWIWIRCSEPAVICTTPTLRRVILCLNPTLQQRERHLSCLLFK